MTIVIRQEHSHLQASKNLIRIVYDEEKRRKKASILNSFKCCFKYSMFIQTFIMYQVKRLSPLFLIPFYHILSSNFLITTLNPKMKVFPYKFSVSAFVIWAYWLDLISFTSIIFDIPVQTEFISIFAANSSKPSITSTKSSIFV